MLLDFFSYGKYSFDKQNFYWDIFCNFDVSVNGITIFNFRIIYSFMHIGIAFHVLKCIHYVLPYVTSIQFLLHSSIQSQVLKRAEFPGIRQ